MLRLLFLLALIGGGFGAGWTVQGWRHGAAETKAAVRTVYVTREQGAINTAAAAKDATAQAEIRYVTRTIVKEVPTYVSPATDARFPLPVGLVRVHDAAAIGIDPARLSDPAGLADDQASDVEASEAASAIAGNYGECRATATRLTELQDWVASQAMAFNAPH